MRGCAFILVLAAAVAVVAAWFAGPALAAVLVEGGLRASGFEATSTSVRVVADPPVSVLTGHAARVEITATNARFDRLDVADLTLTLGDVDLVARSFVDVRGTLSGVTVAQDERRVPISRIELSGPADAATAAVSMSGVDVERLAGAALTNLVGARVSAAQLVAPDRLTFDVVGQRYEGTFVVAPDGALWLTAALPGDPRVEVLQGDPFRVETARVLDGDLVLTGTVDVAGLVSP